jgi:adenosylhomocysteine nucleosidase
VFIGSLCGFSGVNLSQYVLNFVKKTYIAFYEHKFYDRRNTNMNTIAIIGAMPSELCDIRETLGEAEIRRISGYDFYINEFKGKKIINVCCGIAKVNAAVCTQVAIDNFRPDAVINTGIAGGMNRDVKVCDIVISSEVLPHDLDPHFLNDYPPYCGIFKSDENLIKKAAEVCGKFGVNCFNGRIVSGEAFISDDSVKADIIARFNPYAVDMESAAVGHCCYLNDMPYVSVRCISDNADDDGAMSFDKFEKIAAKRVAEIVLEMCTEL